MIVDANGNITVTKDELPQNIIHDIMHDYNRVIRQIIVDDCTNTDQKYYQEEPKILLLILIPQSSLQTSQNVETSKT
jgi:hypothetical protein